MIGLYFSGTGNTKHCAAEFVKHFGEDNTVVSIESPAVNSVVAEHDRVVFAYPVYFSNTPKIVKDFIAGNRSLFSGKRVFIIATMGLFSGDGAGCAARLLKKCGAHIIGGLHLKMPDCIGDVKLLKKSDAENRELIESAGKKIYAAAQNLKQGKPAKEGLSIFCRLAGLLGQRLWFYSKTAGYKNMPQIDKRKCAGCGRCAALCPLGNIQVADGKAVAKGKCTMCYRCFGNCPAKALTILGKRVYEQYRFEKYQ